MDRLRGSHEIDVAWLSSKLGIDVAKATRKTSKKMGGMSAEILYLDVVSRQGAETSLVVKGSQAEPSELRKATGTAREALFYKEAEDLNLSGVVPRCFGAEGNMETGSMIIFLENLEGAVPAGIFFGAGNPNNWGIKDSLPGRSEGNPRPEALSEEAFLLYARLHGNTWRDRGLMEKGWLRGADWLCGKGREAWWASQRQASEAWEVEMGLLKAGKPTIKWDAHLLACLDAAFRKASWDVFQAEVQGLGARPFALVHGDAHPHNALLLGQATPGAQLRLIDFEMVGLGSPAQELGQWNISHFTPEARRFCEHALVGKYHSELNLVLRSRGLDSEADAFSLEACWAEYVAGGAGRWAWFVPILIRMCGPEMGQFFHDQLAEFLRDHVPDPMACPMPRV